MFVPRTVASPSTNGSSPTIARPIVVLPEPDSPTRPTTSPGATVSVDAVDGPERRRPAPLRVLDGDALRGRRPGRRSSATRPAVDVGARGSRSASNSFGTIDAEVGHRRAAAPACTRRVGEPNTWRDGPDLDDPPALHHDHAVGQVGDDAHVVGDQQDAGVDAVAQVAHQLEDLGLHRDVERRRRLVGDEQRRVHRQRLGDHRALSLTARQLVRVRVDAPLRVGDLDELEQLDGAAPGQLRATSPGGCGASRRSGSRRCTRGSAPSSAPGRSSTTSRAPDLAQGALVDADELASAERDRPAHATSSSAAGPSATSPSSTCRSRTRRRSRAPHRRADRTSAPMTAGYHVPSTQKSMSRSRTCRTGSALAVVVTGRRSLRRGRLPRWSRAAGVPIDVRTSADGRHGRRSVPRPSSCCSWSIRSS